MAYVTDPTRPMFTTMHYCTRCGMPATQPDAVFDQLGICVSCRSQEQKMHIDWKQRDADLRQILDKFRGQHPEYDCLVPISGGKDSAYQLYLLTQVYKVRPLACTFSHNWFSETGRKNLDWCLETFDVDHIMFTPRRSVVNRCARRSLELLGDSCWHCHAGVGAFPVQAAVKYGIKLIVYGESAAEASPQATYDKILPYDQHYFFKISAFHYPETFATDYLPLSDLGGFKLPSDGEIAAKGVWGIHIGNYVFWDGERQTEFLRDRYGWREDHVEGTYKCYKSVECRMPGVHDYTKFLKRGYGRTTDHVAQDVRAGLLTLEEGNRLVREIDPHEPPVLDYYLKISGYSREEFYAIMDAHREKVGILTRVEIEAALADAKRQTTPAAKA
ncbi:MAG: N-acetyl sugar amidotransferase [Alphaproteobacteria bacterium]|nr:N-acetyl sugar amidotransferase [Alphaproteobacteria bacterium]